MSNGRSVSELVDMETLERVAPILRNAAHPLRLRILDYLDREAEPRSVSQILHASGCDTQAVISQQLRILKDQGLLFARRQGTHVLYGIADPSVPMLLQCVRSHCRPRVVESRNGSELKWRQNALS